MTVTQEQVDSFHRFASERLSNGGSDLTWQELFHQWRLENPTAAEQADIYAALDESLEDLEAGRHEPAEQAMKELIQKHKLAE